MDSPRKGFQEEVANLCLLDEQSDACFVKEDLLGKTRRRQTRSQTEAVNSLGREGNQKPKDRRTTCTWL